MAIFRVLIVGDYEPLRVVLREIVREMDHLEVIGEALDGLEAVRNAQQLQPDLILMDLAIPKLNGLQAARRLRDLAPRAKILFLSEESCTEIVAEAFNVGGSGYVYKLCVGTELMSAIETVLAGKRFLSSSLTKARRGISDEHRHCAAQSEFRHEVAFYVDDRSFAEDFVRFIETNLHNGNVVLAILTKSHHATVSENLRSHGLDTDAFVKQGTYIPLDARETLSKFMVNDWPDRAKLLKLMREFVERTNTPPQGEHSRVVACGELAPTLFVDGKTEAAIQVEHLWDEIAGSYRVDTLCGYFSHGFDDNSQAFETICTKHSVFSFR